MFHFVPSGKVRLILNIVVFIDIFSYKKDITNKEILKPDEKDFFALRPVMFFSIPGGIRSYQQD